VATITVHLTDSAASLYGTFSDKASAAVTPATTRFLPYGFGGKPAIHCRACATGSCRSGRCINETFGRITVQLALTVSSSTQALQPSGIASAAAFGNATIQRSAVSIAGAGGIASAEVFGAGHCRGPYPVAGWDRQPRAFGNTTVRGGSSRSAAPAALPVPVGTALVYVPGVGRIAAVALSLSVDRSTLR
jgi:hypothetical protein